MCGNFGALIAAIAADSNVFERIPETSSSLSLNETAADVYLQESLHETEKNGGIITNKAPATAPVYTIKVRQGCSGSTGGNFYFEADGVRLTPKACAGHQHR